YWKEPTPENRAALRSFLTPEATRWQYVHGVHDESLVAPESYTLDSALLARPGNDEIQLDLFLDYASNVALYPKFHEYFRTHRPPLLAVWGKNDPFFLPAGAEAFQRDNPGAVVRFFDTGHFALEAHVAEIATTLRGGLLPQNCTGLLEDRHACNRFGEVRGAREPGLQGDSGPAARSWSCGHRDQGVRHQPCRNAHAQGRVGRSCESDRHRVRRAGE